MNKQIKTYSGLDPYAFISYSHKDANMVIGIIEDLCKDLYRIWYDAGIEVGSNWPDAVATHLLCSNMVVFFISKNFIISQNCQREVNYAVAQKKNSICVLLDDTTLSTGMGMQLSVAATIDAKDSDYIKVSKELKEVLGTDYIGDGISGYTSIEKKKKSFNIWRIASINLLIVVLFGSLGFYGYYNGWFKNVGIDNKNIIVEGDKELEVNTFKDNVSMNVLLRSYNGESLYICGNTMVSIGDYIVYKDGEWSVNDELIEKGSMTSCAVISDKNLIYLAIVNESIKDFSELKDSKELIYLDISGNPVEDLSFLKDLTNLQVLKLIDVEIKDYSLINSLPNLKYLYISEDQLPIVKESINIAKLDVVIK